jgi:hypothetical protein
MMKLWNWIGSSPVMYFATPAGPAVSSDGGAGAGGGGGAPPAPAAPSPSQGGTQGQQGPQPGQDNIRQLRENYENIKKEFEPWTKLNVKPEQVTQFQGVYQKVYSSAAEIGRQLGYPDDEIAEALAEDPIKTLDYLRNAAAQRQEADGRDGAPDLSELVAQHVEQAIGPIQQRENFRMTNEANSLFERTVHGLASEVFKAEGFDIGQISQDEVDLLTNATSEILKYDDAALRSLKYEGKVAPIQKAFSEARTMLDKYYMSRTARERGRTGGGPRGPGQPPQQNGNRRPTLDEMIDNPDSIRTAQGKPGYSG